MYVCVKLKVNKDKETVCVCVIWFMPKLVAIWFFGLNDKVTHRQHHINLMKQYNQFVGQMMHFTAIRKPNMESKLEPLELVTIGRKFR